MKIKKSDIVLAITSLLVLFCCMVDIKIINDFVSYGLRVYLRLAMIAGYIALGFIKKKKYSKVFYLISVMMGVIFLGCVLNGYDWNSTISTITVSYLPCLFLEYNKKRIYNIIKIWCIALLILVTVDIVSMIMYPNGLYFDGLYSDNWFLGYKTNRFNYYLPLCVFSAFLSFAIFKKCKAYIFLIIAIEIFGMMFTQATAAGVALLIFAVLLFIINLLDAGKIKGRNKFFSLLFSYKAAFLVYFSSLAVVFLISYLPLVQNIVYLLFKKDATLTTRTAIWAACLIQVLKHPLIGIGFITISEFTKITGNWYATSAHNMILTILVAGGAVSLVIYIIVMFLSIHNIDIRNRSLLCLLLGVLAFWIVGLTSSSYAFSTFGFLFYDLLYLNSNNKANNIKGVNQDVLQ